MVRKGVRDYLCIFGVKLDEAENRKRSGDPRMISTDASKVKVPVVPTNEELSMAHQTLKVVSSS